MNNYKYHQLIFLLLIVLLSGCATTTNYSKRGDVHEFIDRMNTKHHFDREELCTLFSKVKCEPKIIKTMDKPHEGKATPWCAYRAIFLTPEKIKQGVKFWQKHAETLAAVEQQYGVPAEIIVAIIGVETQYGKNKGSYRVIDALTNLAFDYPRRSKYFCGELEEYLLLTREQSLDPLEPVGSYAGAIGQPQFMPSSYRHYGIDFSGSHHADLCNNSADAIASVANYFKAHGWRTGEPIAMRANVYGDDYLKFATKKLKPSFSLEELSECGITPRDKVSPTMLATFMIFETDSAPQYWLGFHNFYVITRYNSSGYYAMAVHQLSQAILRERGEG